MPQKKKKFLIVDANAILHRAWHALPPMTLKDGRMVNAVYGFVTTIFKALKEFKPEFCAVCFDRKEKTFRHEEFAEYKAGRVKQPDEFYSQIPLAKQILEALNIKIFEKAGFEADDIIGTLCERRQVNRDDVLSIIATGDQDALQLVDDNTEVFTLRKGMSDTIVYNEKAVKEKFEGLAPSQLADFKGLAGDAPDNISGVPGVGGKTAIALLNEFGSIEKMYQKIEPKEYKNVKISERLFRLLQENEALARQSKKLGTIVRDVPLDFNLNDCLLGTYDKDKVFEIFHDFEFKSLLNRLPEFGEEQAKPQEEKMAENGHQYHFIKQAAEFEKFFAEFKKQKIFVFDTETDGLNVFRAKLLGISFCWQDGEAYYVEARSEFLKELKPIFEDEAIKKAGHNMKFDVKVLKLNGIEVVNHYFDTMIASYLLNPGTRAHKLDDLVFRELGYQMTKITELIGKGKGQTTLGFVDPLKVANYSCEDADYTWRLIDKLKPQLEKNKLEDLFAKIEMPLIAALVEMELNGVKIDVEHLKKLSKKAGRRIEVLTEKIHKAAGGKFNISSPQQLKEVLFGKLKLSPIGLGKTKTGISTAADELEKLRGLHPVIELVEEYRELTKLESTYIDALPRLVEPATGRVHTEFNQTITATGRLSSSNPNLQNIPNRTEFGREIRRAFIAERGNKIISADYSQVELRVIACLSGDENMINVFRRNEDIHQATAAKIFNVPLEKVTKEMRFAAKEVNFGVLYGMGAWGLASRKKISRHEAKDFIDKYFKTFSKVKEYIEKMKDAARQQGFVETIFGRRRYLPEINSGVQQVRAAAERMAINMPIQGTAADLMKIAMIEVDKAIKQPFDSPSTSSGSLRVTKIKNQKIRMLLQVHDELVFEAPAEVVEKIAKIIDDKMEKIHKFCVPIKVETEAGKNWQEMKPMF
ncbi:DNA polymerase I [Candidatus Falkowbacteria bacterium]|nr:DNA polymerase I [Candidatus Falkowbacteria bacterium]